MGSGNYTEVKTTQGERRFWRCAHLRDAHFQGQRYGRDCRNTGGVIKTGLFLGFMMSLYTTPTFINLKGNPEKCYFENWRE